MATWHDLPQEIRLQILKLFSNGIVFDYILSPLHWIPVPEDKSRVFTWPESPPSLKSLSSAVRTCRSFHDALTRDISMRKDGITPYALLREIQTNQLALEVNPSYVGDRIYIRNLYASSGRFWKNDAVLGEPECMLSILENLSPKSWVVLLPHLEPWILKHAIRTYPMKWAIVRGREIPIGVSRTNRGRTEDVPFFLGSWKIQRTEDSESENRVTIYSLKGRGKASSRILAEYPGFREMEGSAENTWWFIQLENGWEIRKTRWVLVNYKEKRIFGGSVKPGFFAWEDIWEPESWTVVGKQSTLGEYWRKGRVQDSDTETEDSDTDFDAEM